MGLLVFVLLFAVAHGGNHRIVKRQAVNSAEQLWPRNTVNYRFDYSFSSREGNNIRKAMKEWETFTCVKFQEVGRASQVHSAKFVRNEGGCFSTSGYAEYDEQTVNLGEDCMDPDIVLHELGHTIGLLHEQERTNRDRYVEIDANRIKSEYIDQFQKAADQTDYGLPYSYRSIMHYGKDFFNKKGKIAILARNKKFIDIIGNARHLSFKDAWIVNKMYKCSGHCSNAPTCPPDAFLGKDCRCWCRSVAFTAVDCLSGRAIDPSRVRPKSGRVKVNSDSGNVFFWSDHEVDWYEAKRNCKNMGGNLVEFKTSNILPDIENNIQDLVDENYDPEGKYKSSFFWTGGNDIKQEGSFRWLDGSTVSLSGLSMSRGEPNNGNGMNDDCLVIFPQYGSEFADWDCGKHLRYICQLRSATCHDTTPTCPYYKTIGLCSVAKLARKCRMTCGRCSIVKRRPAKRTQPHEIATDALMETRTYQKSSFR